MYRILLVIVLIAVVFVSCQKSTDENKDLKDSLNELKLDPEETTGKDCFEFVYPLDVKLEDGSIITLNSDEEMISLKESCDKDARKCFEFIYPISLTFKDGTTKAINSNEDMKRVYEWCKGDKDPCFTFIFPVTFTMPDGSTITIEKEEDMRLLKQWYNENPGYEERPTLQYPVEVKFKGEILTINNDDEMMRLRKACSEDDKPCFDFIYPIDFMMPDGSIITLEKPEDRIALREWYVENPGYEGKPVLQYPVEIKFIKDGTILIINNDDEMNRAKKKCE